MTNEENEKRQRLLKLVEEAVLEDIALREQFKVGDKFRFIRDRLQALKSRIEESLASSIKVEAPQMTLLEDETLVYVYLFNAQGMNLKTWTKMLMPNVFYEYSINRPIYNDLKFIQAIIRGKANRAQHGYLTFAVKKEHLILSESPPKDLLGNPVVKVKEGSLKPNRFIEFIHNEQSYRLNEQGEMVNK